MYYLQSRYYDPEVGRFLNADALASTGQGILGNNMFAYCGNNPVCRYDPFGHAFTDIFAVCYGGYGDGKTVIGYAESGAYSEDLLQEALNSYVPEMDRCIDSTLFVTAELVGTYTTNVAGTLDKIAALAGIPALLIYFCPGLGQISIGATTLAAIANPLGAASTIYGVYRAFASDEFNISDKTYDQYCVTVKWAEVIHPGGDQSLYIYREHNVSVYYILKTIDGCDVLEYQYYTYSSNSTMH